MEIEDFFSSEAEAAARVEKFRTLPSSIRTMYRFKARNWLLKDEREWFTSLNEADRTDYLEIFAAFFWQEVLTEVQTEKDFNEFCAIWGIEQNA